MLAGPRANHCGRISAVGHRLLTPCLRLFPIKPYLLPQLFYYTHLMVNLSKRSHIHFNPPKTSASFSAREVFYFMLARVQARHPLLVFVGRPDASTSNSSESSNKSTIHFTPATTSPTFFRLRDIPVCVGSRPGHNPLSYLRRMARLLPIESVEALAYPLHPSEGPLDILHRRRDIPVTSPH